MKQALIQLHIAVFLAGFTGILGRLISLDEGQLVWYRMLIASAALWLLYYFTKQLEKLQARQMGLLLATGIIVALHWLTFFGSIKLSNVSIALTCFSATGFFTALLEPLLLRKKTEITELLLGLLTIAGIALIFHFDPQYKTGIIVGIISSLLAACFSVLNKKFVATITPRMITLYELTGGWLALCIALPFYLQFNGKQFQLPGVTNWLWLLVLGILCTVVQFNLFMQSLRKVSAFTQNLTLNLEPVYGIILAFIIFKENKYLSSGFYLGLALIMLAVVVQTLRVVKKKVPV
jgi:drug/metabolite transporter (DMT)-like permease